MYSKLAACGVRLRTCLCKSTVRSDESSVTCSCGGPFGSSITGGACCSSYCNQSILTVQCSCGWPADQDHFHALLLTLCWPLLPLSCGILAVVACRLFMQSTADLTVLHCTALQVQGTGRAGHQSIAPGCSLDPAVPPVPSAQGPMGSRNRQPLRCGRLLRSVPSDSNLLSHGHVCWAYTC